MADTLTALFGLFIVVSIAWVACGCITTRHRLEHDRKLEDRLALMREAEITRRAYRDRYSDL